MAWGWGGGMAVKWNRGWRDSGTAGWVETKMAVGREERASETWRERRGLESPTLPIYPLPQVLCFGRPLSL